MSTQFASNNPTSYFGLEATNPGQNWFRDRDPLPSDFRNYHIGDRWIHVDPLNPGSASIWSLVSKSATAGFWTVLGGGMFAVSSILTDDANLVDPIAGVIALTGDSVQGLSTSEPVAGTAEITIADASSVQKGVVTVDSVAHGLLVGTATQSAISSTTAGTAGQTLISGGGAADPNWTTFINTDAAGIVSLPANSSSSAYLSADLANQVGDVGTVVTVVFDQEDYDTRSEYNQGNGIFTATKAGLYLINTTVGLFNIAATHTVGNLSIWIGGTKWWQIQFNPAATVDGSIKKQLSVSGSVVLSLLAGNQVKVTVEVAGGPNTVGFLGATNVHTELQVTKLA